MPAIMPNCPILTVSVESDSVAGCVGQNFSQIGGAGGLKPFTMIR